MAAECHFNLCPSPRQVFASSIAVYGELPAAGADESAVPRPGLTYDAQKGITEIKF